MAISINKSNKVWFITGASRGFGREIASAALARGDFVVAAARRKEGIQEALGQHTNLISVVLDVKDESQAVAAAKQAIDHFGRIDILVNNAGYGLLGAIEEASSSEVENLFSTNVFGLLNVTRAILPYMRKARSGFIINMSSGGGYSASIPGWGLYCASKFAVEGLTESLAQEVLPFGIRATLVEPGAFRTDFLDASSLVMAETIIPEYSNSVGKMRGMMDSVNHHQSGDPKKLAAAIMALADSDNPPMRLPMGSDAFSAIKAKNQSVDAELDQWHDLIVSTDFEDK